MNERVLGDYKLIRQIGKGILGEVFLSEHRFIKKQYALKILDQKLVSKPGFVERFEKDIALLAALDHPHILKIHHVSYAEGHYFLVLDWIVDETGKSVNLSHYFSFPQTKLEEKEIYIFLTQVASAIDYIHSKKQESHQLFHQALNLNNILIRKKESGFYPYLVDTGLSHLLGSAEVFKRTCSGLFDQSENEFEDFSFPQIYGFLAPEQKKINTSQEINSKVDIYAFGVLAYYLLMRQLPEGIFPKPSSKGFTAYNWDYLIKECLQYDPLNRPSALLPLIDEIKARKTEEQEDHANINNLELSSEVSDFFINNAALKVEVASFNPEVSESLSVSTAPKVVLKPLLYTPQLQRPEKDLDPGAIFQIQSSVKTYNPEPKDISNIEPLLTEMVVVPGGEFYRGSADGSRDETPRHQVIISSFAIDIHPVTNEQFVRFLEVMGGEKDNHHNDIIRLRDSRIKRSGGKLTIESGYSKHPVVGVTWYGGIAYAKWVGKRLPTEAEWEIAARGGKEVFLYPCGDDIEKSQANFFSSDTTAVMSYAPNAYGLYDVSGNVYEWCQDWYGYNYYEHSMQEPENPQGPLQGVYRVLRGGCWKSLKEDLRCSRRHRNNPGTVNSTYGFRCAADVQSS